MTVQRTMLAAATAVLFALALPAFAADTPKPATAAKPAAAPAKPAVPAAKPAATPAKPAATAAKPAAPAAMAMPGKIAEFWIFWPKAGKAPEFEAAVKAHVAWLKQAGDKFVWEAYQPVVGTDITYFTYRSGQHQWADLDTEAAWDAANKSDEVFNRNVGPLVERYQHFFAEEDYANSHWVESPDYRYFSVNEHKLKPGASGAIAAAIGKIHQGLEAGGWPMSYSISRSIGGSGGLTLVFPYKSYADMDDPKPGFMAVLAKGMGTAEAAQKAMTEFDDSVTETNTTIYKVRPDLSTPK